ncbi:MAG TPA: hypothetical protein VMU45_12595, partial [Candidatus Eisenbacteria bacterium]|nr:hypothetical protein [Candidatus Eisenbacteria bacterium]
MKARVIPLFIVLLGSVGGLYGSWTIGDHAATSMAFDLAGKFHGVSGMERASQGLTYITNQSGEWVSVTVDYDPLSRAYTHSLAVDAGGKAHVAYVRGRDVVYATNSTGVWATEVVATPAKYPPFSQSTAIKVTGSSTIEVWFLDPTRIPSWTLQHASKTGSGPWVLVQVGDLIYKLGWADLFLDSANHVHLCYWSGASSEGFTDATLKYGTDVSGTWSDEVIPESITYGGVHDDFTRCSIAQDNRGYLHIGAVVPDALFYATNSTGSWEKKPRIDCLSGKSRTCPNGFYNPSGVAIGVKACDQIYLAYVDSNGLKCDVHANDQWTTSVVDSAGWFDQATILRDPDDHLRFDRYTYWPPPRTITTFAGNGTGGFSGDGGPATEASLWSPYGVTVHPNGDVLIADWTNCAIRRVRGGVIDTVAGQGGKCGFAGDGGPPNKALLNTPSRVVVDALGDLYISDSLNQRIRKIHDGIITTFAGTGNGTGAYGGDDGPAVQASLNAPVGLAIGPTSDLFIADTQNNRIRMVRQGIISTVAGNGADCQQGCYKGNGVDEDPLAVPLARPYSIAFDSSGRLLIMDTWNYRLWRLSNGRMTSIAGNGSPELAGDNVPARSASISHCEGIALDGQSNMYVSDMFVRGKAGPIRMIDSSTEYIHTIAGSVQDDFCGDCGPARDARFSGNVDVAAKSDGTLFVADMNNNRVRKITSPISAPEVTTPQATGVTESGAVLNGQVNPNGTETE